MSDLLDHKSEAISWLKELLEKIEDATEYGNDEIVNTTLMYAGSRAQVHATLALVQQQEIANLIAFYELDQRNASIDPDFSVRLFCEIRDRLGLS